ncbi:probable GABA transporter 2 isoform X1 [Oryza glaberrima]|uniref:probable GABA transporter 2 isoform X1 n=1 Tax=Oryza glaberrima TaxID=4538 RepID=UPI00224C5F51|nr:probable GABA transporter 2 isoform X1 [Oryza glaberrima]
MAHAAFDAEAGAAAKPPAADAGAAFVLESKGTWWHAGFHLTTAIVGPTVLTLPYALRGMGWALGLTVLTAVGAVTFYEYSLMSRVLEHCEARGRRHIRFRELAADVLGSGWMFYFVVIVQTAINTGVSIGTILLAADCLEIMYTSLSPNGPLKLYHFIIIVAVALAFLSQLPSFHSLRHINFASLLLSLGYTILVSAACIGAGLSKDAPVKDYTLSSSKSEQTFNAFLSISILASVYGNGILPEIQIYGGPFSNRRLQATLAPPAAGKMMKALVLCYSVIAFAFYIPSITGYWAFGSHVQSNVLKSLMPDTGPALAPTWLLGLAVLFVLLQLLAIGLVYSQVAYEIMEKSSADATRGKFSRRNVVPRLLLRTLYLAFCAFMAAMLPFFGDIVGVVGAVGFIPLDFVLPVVMYNIALAPPRRSPMFLANTAIMVVFSGVGAIGAFASIRKLVLDAGQFKLFSNNVVD